jgi:hypothetical protein
LDLSWHLPPDLTRLAGPAPMFMNAERSLGLGLVWVQDQQWAQVVSKESWSPVYGVKKPAVVLHVEREATLPAEFATLLVPTFTAHTDLGILVRLDNKSDPAAPVVYQYTTGSEEHRFFFATGKPWKLDGWASDAEFLYWQADETGVQRIVLCYASYLDFQGRRTCSAERQVKSCELVRAGAGREVPARTDSVVLHHWPERPRPTSAMLVETVPDLDGAGS